ncbi:MAG: CBS domain-containing protein [Acidobacteria bacterium]|nr:CBS domain-containing protein [Acidobacteriota bacterium]
MKVKELIQREPFCCSVTDTVQEAAKLMKVNDIGSLPVVSDQQLRKLEGIVTDRDLCCRTLAEGKDPATTLVEAAMTPDPVTCKPEDDVEDCSKMMQEKQVRRVPVVNDSGSCIGVVAQADIALHAKPKKVGELVAEISKPRRTSAAIRLAS